MAEKVGSPVPLHTSVSDAQPGRPKFGWATAAEAYDPDADRKANPDFLTPVDEYIKRFAVREAYRTEAGREVRPALEAVFLNPVLDAGGRAVERWKPQRLTSVQEVKDFHATREGKAKQLLEVMGDSFDFNGASQSRFFDSTRLIDTEYVPLMWGPFYKQLYIYDYLAMHARAFEMVNHNALAASAVKLLARFTLGRGVSFIIKHPQVRAVWEEFWERNRMRQQLRQIARDLTWQGEVMVRYYDSATSRGYTTVKVIDPSSCWEIITDPEDVDKVYYYHFQWPTPYQIWVSGKIPVTKYIIQQVPPTNIQHMKINVSAQERRGRSELLPAMPWFKRFNDFYNGTTIKAILEANLVYKLQLKGDQVDVDAAKQDPSLTTLPPPGGVWVENEAAVLTPVSAQLTGGGARGAQGIGQQIAAIIATSMNLPSEYFNIEGSSAARATALVRTDPAVKTIEDRQQLLREFLEDMFDRVLEAAINAGRIDVSAARRDPELGDEEDE